MEYQWVFHKNPKKYQGDIPVDVEHIGKDSKILRMKEILELETSVYEVRTWYKSQ